MTTSFNQRDRLDCIFSSPTAAYIHIPFCRRRCYYCDFPISVVGDNRRKQDYNRATGNTYSLIEDYVEALCQEIKLTFPSQQPLTTVFFGGGTPSLLPVSFLEKILTIIEKHFGIASAAEISLELDPGTFNRAQLQEYLSLGINRVSLGVQAFQEHLLQICGRTHSLQDVFTAIELIKQVNIPNFSLDLISGLPQQNIEHWQESLEKAIAIAPHHLSCYDLVLEPVTPFGKQYQPGKKPLPTDEDTAAMYRLASKLLTSAGYIHYEISNYAKLGYQCRHNRIYWENKSYYGFGMGAASYFDGKRFTHPRTRREYYAWLKAGADIDIPALSKTDYLLETLMLGLRLAEGVSIDQIRQQFGEGVIKQIWTCVHPYYQQGWLAVEQDGKIMKLDSNYSLTRIQGRLKLTKPEGFLFSNIILAALFEQLG